MEKTEEKLIMEEQKILDDLILKMDNAILELNKELTKGKLKALKNNGLPEAYGLLIQEQTYKNETKSKINNLKIGKDELYGTRMILRYENDDVGEDELKIGLHSYGKYNEDFIRDWKTPICRPYMLNDSLIDYDYIDEKTKEKTHFTLKLKRDVNIDFEKIKKVVQLYPKLSEETEKIIADEFLQKLLERRKEKEFKNIVFSIQKKQGEIIQKPINTNLIVQGCAGSGKSMIMMHRLPIIIYDNNNLSRKSLYIVTPSSTYIKMAENMRHDLEIEDLNIGTIEQYYDYVIQKYGFKENEYEKIDYNLKPNSEKVKYIYSSKCVEDINLEINQIINNNYIDFNFAYSLFNIKEVEKNSETPAVAVRGKLLNIQNILNENEKVLKKYFNSLRNIIDNLKNFSVMLSNRKKKIYSEIDRKIQREIDLIKKIHKELNKIDSENNEEKYNNRKSIINSAEKRIADLQETREIVLLDEEYFSYLEKQSESINEFLLNYAGIKTERENTKDDALYNAIKNRFEFEEYINCLRETIGQKEDIYFEYVEALDVTMDKISEDVTLINKYEYRFLDLEYIEKLKQLSQYYEKLNKEIVKDIYNKYVNYVIGKNNTEEKAYSFSPYLYLQIIYLYRGIHNNVSESLISIDEAQNLSVEEYKLIKAVNRNSVILNLFGDIRQHIEGSKGLDSWNELKDIKNFEIKELNENYRNARQITEYCKKRFKMKMTAINLDGNGVHELCDFSEYKEKLFKIFHRPKETGICCIIVKNKEEANNVLEFLNPFKNRICNMTDDSNELNYNLWNLMLVEQAKGLEFQTVFAISGRMTENEKYIAYTRALDELYIYDFEIPLNEKENEKIIEEKKISEEKLVVKEKRKSKRKIGESDKSPITVKEFFESVNMKVIDSRKETGYLWIIGKREEIEKIVNKAVEKFGITGAYGAGKGSGFKEGWYTKTKK